MFGLFGFKIVMRYAFGDSVAWADELGVLLFIWVIFWGCAFVVTDREQLLSTWSTKHSQRRDSAPLRSRARC